MYFLSGFLKTKFQLDFVLYQTVSLNLFTPRSSAGSDWNAGPVLPAAILSFFHPPSA